MVRKRVTVVVNTETIMGIFNTIDIAHILYKRKIVGIIIGAIKAIYTVEVFSTFYAANISNMLNIKNITENVNTIENLYFLFSINSKYSRNNEYVHYSTTDINLKI